MSKYEQQVIKLTQELRITQQTVMQLKSKIKILQKQIDLLESKQESKCESCIWFKNGLCTHFGVITGYVSHCKKFQSYKT
jgi:hypothetical protein